ncbi:uncharacterized protein LOC112467862 [Temnothorax curvispinosus]|uniref:Uncharacterized protein LOC112467862 n=1 Tax=Temnothorax curvispinosus TaxID=300111 RepID=A0A6J1RCJ7_9HYME|nr:uncharacterized protein LOC112467862 [Temnothorax curvispinosus]
MGKFIVLLCFTLLAITSVMGCKPPGQPCSSDADCCAEFVCNPWAGRCTKGPPGTGNAKPGGPWGVGGPGTDVEWPQNEPTPAQ